MPSEQSAEPPAQHPAEPVWLPVANAARRLGVTEQAVRRRVRAGTIETKREVVGNRSRLLVRIDAPTTEPSPRENHLQEPELVTLRGEVALLNQRVQHLEELLAEVRSERDGIRSELERRLDEARSERRLLQEAHEAEVDRLLVVIEQLTAPEQRPQRRPWPGLRVWWRRLIEGEG